MSYFAILGVVSIFTMTILTAVLTVAMFFESLDYVDGKEVFVKKYAIISSVSFDLEGIKISSTFSQYLS